MSTILNDDVKPQGDSRSHRFRQSRLALITGSLDYRYFQGSPFFTAEATRETMGTTQFEGENHRRITPYVQELYGKNRIRGPLVESVDRVVRNLQPYPSPSASDVKYDVAIIGSGPHGAAVAAYLREKRPELRTLMIEANDKLGGQWRSYGPKPVFQMNSRVRPASRLLPALPRTEGNINPMGMYAPVELSDIPTSGYPWNTDIGNVCALNAFLSASEVMVGTKVLKIDAGYDEKGLACRIMIVKQAGQERQITAKIVVDATGSNAGKSQVSKFLQTEIPDGYFSTADLYKHFAQHDSPLDRFHNQQVAVIGKGDGALSCLEALLGNLPTETYGRSGVGRMRPRQINWIGAPGEFAEDIANCLRTRYKNGIVQSLRPSPSSDRGMIVPTPLNAEYVTKGTDQFFEVKTGERLLFPTVVIDCTSSAGAGKSQTVSWNPNYYVGPNSGAQLSERTLKKISDLGIPENNVSLWATMQATDGLAAEILRFV